MPKNKITFWLSVLLFLLIPGIGVIDYFTGPNITFALIYMIPVSAIAWLNARYTIFVASSLAAITWIIVDYFSGRFPLSVITYTWNFSSRWIVLLIVATLFSMLKRTLLDTHDLSRRDPLTNALNKRGFMELAEHEIYRSTRTGHALTIAFLDVDNFKTVNDTFGHNAGDLLLATIVKSLHLHTRQIDLIGRVGGDEFIIVLPDTGQDAGRATIAKLRDVLMDDMVKNNWPVTFSVGVLTCIQAPPSVDAMIGMADKLMYTVKAGPKNNVVFSIYSGD